MDLSKKKLQLIFIASLAISFVLYGNTISGAFVYDDNLFSAWNNVKTVDHLGSLWLQPYDTNHLIAGSYRPLALFSFALNFILFGNSPISFHIVNIVLNALAVFLFFLLALKLFKNTKLAIFSSLFYSFLPIHTEAVAFIKSRDEILATIFILLAWLLFIKSTEKNEINFKGIIGSSFLFLLSVFSKETFIIVPLLFFFVLVIQRGRINIKIKDLAFMAMLFLPVILFYFIMRVKVLGIYAFANSPTTYIENPIINANFWQHLWTPLKIAFLYIGKIFIPINLSATYYFNKITLVSSPLHSMQAIWGLLLLALLVFLIINRRTRRTPLGVGALVFLISYFIVSKFVLQTADIMAERWMYFPSMGLSLIAGHLIYKVYNFKKAIGVTMITVILVAYSITTVSRNRVWLTSESLFGSMINNAPNSIQGYLMLYILNVNHKPVDAVASWVESAYNIAPDWPAALDEKGVVETKRGNFELAEKYFVNAIEKDKQNNSIYKENLGKLYVTSANSYIHNGRYNDAIMQLTKFRKLEPTFWAPYYSLGQVYFLKKDYAKASYYLNRALLFDPNNSSVKKSIEILRTYNYSVKSNQ